MCGSVGEDTGWSRAHHNNLKIMRPAGNSNNQYQASVVSAARKEEVLRFHSRRDAFAKYANFELVQSSAIFQFPS